MLKLFQHISDSSFIFQILASDPYTLLHISHGTYENISRTLTKKRHMLLQISISTHHKKKNKEKNLNYFMAKSDELSLPLPGSEKND